MSTNQEPTESEFMRIADELLNRLDNILTDFEDDIDVTRQGDGILELSFNDDSKIIINRHIVAREIWLAARSGAYHFRCQNGCWQDTRGQFDLATRLSALLSDALGEEVRLAF